MIDKFPQYQQLKHLNTKIITKCYAGSPGPGFGQSQKSDRVKSVKGIPSLIFGYGFFLIYFPVYINKQNKTPVRCSLASRHVIDIVIPKIAD